MIHLTQNAQDRISVILKDNQSAIGISIGVISGGCSGLKYEIDIMNEYSEDYELVEINQIKLFIKKDSILYLLNSKMDYTESKFDSEFVFHNPSAQDQCGCGKSFAI